jgi:hypothetical protein
VSEQPGPTFLIIGAARSGTTLLSQVLSRHPDVCFTDPKEPHFLAFAGQRVDFVGPGDTDSINRYTITDESGWRGLFEPGAGCTQRGEGSVSTLYYTRTAMENITRYCPDVRLIAVLRDPVDRAFSAYSYLVGRGRETETFERGLDLEEERIAANWHHMWHYTRMGHYSDQLKPFLSAFGEERLLVLGYEDLVGDPAMKLGTCFSFLDLDQAGVEELGEPVNIGGKPQSRSLTQAMSWMRKQAALRTLVRATTPLGARDWLRRSNLKRMQMPEDMKQRLEAHFSDERRALGELLGPNSPSWCGTTSMRGR